MEVNIYNSSNKRGKKGGQEFRASSSYLESSKPAWTTWDQKKKKNHKIHTYLIFNVLKYIIWLLINKILAYAMSTVNFFTCVITS